MSSETEIQILNAAEILFSEHGIETVSIRDIINKAGTNIASVNYHFGSKEALIIAILKRRIEPMNQRRLELLAQVKKYNLREIITAFISPAFRMADTKPEDRKFCRLIGRVMNETDERLKQELRILFDEVMAKFLKALQIACPKISKADLQYRFFFIIGAMAHSLMHWDLISGQSGSSHSSELEENLINFACRSLTV